MGTRRAKRPKMRAWPRGDQHVPADKLVPPVLEVIEAGYTMQRNVSPSGIRSIHYDGYNIGDVELAGCLSPAEAFSKGGLTYHHERGQGLLEVALYVMFQLGVEQGRRLTRAELGRELGAYKRMVDVLSKGRKSLPKREGAE